MDANNINDTVAEKIVAEFEEHLSADSKATKTLESYVGDISTFFG